MSVERVALDVMDKLKEVLLEKITEMIPNLLKEVMIPSLFKEITPTITHLAKDVVETYLRDNDTVQQRVKECLTSTDEEFRSFKKTFSPYINEKLKEREKAQYQHTRCVNLLQIYNDCMQKDPLYIPKKFRSDRYHVMSSNELNVLTQMELKKFQSECQILNLRREEYSERASHIDKQIEALINREDLSSSARTKCLERWQILVKEDTDRIVSKWTKKLDGMRKAFDRDNEFLQRHQKTRVRTGTNMSSNAEIKTTQERLVTSDKGSFSVTFIPATIDSASTANTSTENSIPTETSSKNTVPIAPCLTSTSNRQSVSKQTSPPKNLVTQSSNHPPLKTTPTVSYCQALTSPRKLRSSTSPDEN